FRSSREPQGSGAIRVGDRRAWRRAKPMTRPAPSTRLRSLLKQALSFALALGIWFSPIPAGLTKEAWHLFAIFAAAIFAVILNSLDRKSTRLNSSHVAISYAVFCLKK